MSGGARRMAFYVDARSCTGCKACQVACKDENGLAPELLWRRVVSVEGGGWERRGPAWEHHTRAYNVSLSCMHCARPICAEVCPSRAARAREDGVVAIDPDRCLGCGYCQLACPYGAPVLDADRRVMTKCDLCRHRLDAGQPPACVAACQMRVLEAGPLEELKERHGEGASPCPLPDRHLTEPSVVLEPHPDALGSADGLRVANREELG